MKNGSCVGFSMVSVAVSEFHDSKPIARTVMAQNDKAGDCLPVAPLRELDINSNDTTEQQKRTHAERKGSAADGCHPMAPRSGRFSVLYVRYPSRQVYTLSGRVARALRSPRSAERATGQALARFSEGHLNGHRRPTPACSRRRPRLRSAGAAETWYVGRTSQPALPLLRLLGASRSKGPVLAVRLVVSRYSTRARERGERGFLAAEISASVWRFHVEE
jgi:hypothetical protein